MAEDGIVSFEDFAKIDLRVGEIKKAARLENSEKLIRFGVDFGPLGERVR